MALRTLGRTIAARRWVVLGLAAAAVAVAGWYGNGAAARLSTGGYQDHSSPSYQAATSLSHRFGVSPPAVVVVARATSPGATISTPGVQVAGRQLERRLAGLPGVVGASSYWSVSRSDPAAAAGLVSRDGRYALLVAGLKGSEQQSMHEATHIAGVLDGVQGPLSVQVGGPALVNAQITARSEAGLARAEEIAFPVVFVLLVIVFGGLVAAALPLVIGGVAVVGTLALLRAIAAVTPVSVFALNITTGLGLGLAIDYSLFLLSRYREQRAAGMEPAGAIAAATATAGRTILFSATTVMLSLATMALFPLYFLRSLAYAGVAVVGLAALSAIVVLPALIAVSGRLVDRTSLFSKSAVAGESRTWRSIASLAMKRPLPLAAAVAVVLASFAIPFASVHFGLVDSRVLPPAASARQVAQVVDTRFSQAQASAVDVVGTSARSASRARTAGLAPYARHLSTVQGVAGVQSAVGQFVSGRQVGPGLSQLSKTGIGTYLVVLPRPSYRESTTLLASLEAVPSPFPVRFTGVAAQLHDTEAALGARIPLAAGLIGVATLVLVAGFTGSILLAVEAVVLGALSLGASFGALVYVFQQGHLQWLVGPFTATGSLDATTPILMFCMAFGLSMDYELFLLSRICERHRSGADVTEAVTSGLAATGRLITAAALLVAIVFALIGTSGVSFIKLMGVGMAVAVLLDATVVRALLVPSVIRLGSTASFWGPRWLLAVNRRLLEVD